MNRWIVAVLSATKAVAKRKPEKYQAFAGFEPMTSAMPLQQSWVLNLFQAFVLLDPWYSELR